MEIYARTSGELVNEDIDYPYLRKKKKKRLGIKFDQIVKVKPDDWGKGKKYLFGMEMPVSEDLSSD